ncbi:hypothetical protein H9Q69_003892 [Fusarium xylarioides]|uniref:Uncharacterized protein n=1 Tax=Fusarium xylarioides TaxID=221167 RepID=A0A9P7KYN5_9HYPO|nr:hypothetical protein H9Q72_014266 [Fusarium xylarioides]KAG5797064.1 hypothetical protein H9Q69_003892 [Fusarium xylarioides]
MSQLIRPFAFPRHSITRSIQPFSNIIRLTHSQSDSDNHAPETPEVTLEMVYKEIREQNKELREQKQVIHKIQRYQQDQERKEKQRILEEEQRHWLLKFFHNHENKFK